jgi:hypothetical protein
MVLLDDGFIDRPLTGLVLETRETQWSRSSGDGDHILEVLVLWNEPLPSNYTHDGVESTLTWTFEDVLEVVG